MSESSTRKIKLEVLDVKNNQTTLYDSINQAVEALNIENAQVISNYLIRNQKKPYKGLYF